MPSLSNLVTWWDCLKNKIIIKEKKKAGNVAQYRGPCESSVSPKNLFLYQDIYEMKFLLIYVRFFPLLFASISLLQKYILDCPNRLVTVMSAQWREHGKGFSFTLLLMLNTLHLVLREGTQLFIWGEPGFSGCHHIPGAPDTPPDTPPGSTSFVPRHIRKQDIDSNLSRGVQSQKLSPLFTATHSS